jgi:hypothetical protein
MGRQAMVVAMMPRVRITIRRTEEDATSESRSRWDVREDFRSNLASLRNLYQRGKLWLELYLITE